ncbi:MAG TPA: nucleotidyltransferase family protein [Candidatus Latescibacteria bacterium]|jgi:NDP-sugar pyrophosphorylase family protein|nr:nucleotidyltransferase family protein [Candidatus Latescibacterota bacterium]HJP32750.1 nucleotidyltransferase family protein [Candidatus Latescibacterota bacterium]
MKAMVLAAGRGTRLRPLTDSVPKPMIPIGDRPLLEHVVNLLRQHGFDDLVINLSHLPDKIRDHFGNGSAFDVSIRYSLEPRMLGTAGALGPVADHFRDEDFLVYYADNLTNADLGALWRDHLAAGAAMTVGLLWMPDPAGRGIVGLDENGRIDRWLEKPEPDQVFDDYLINGGIYAVHPHVLDTIASTGSPDFAHDVLPELLADGQHLYGHRLQGQLFSTDTPERYEATLRAVESGAFSPP